MEGGPEGGPSMLDGGPTKLRREPVDFHALRSRESGRQQFVYVHLLVPNEWTVKRGHDVADELTDALGRALPGVHTFVHMEPISDPSSYGHEYLPEEMP